MTPLHAAELMEILHEHRPITPELEARWRLLKRRHCVRQAQARYQRTEKGRAAQGKYERTTKGKATKARYDASQKGRASRARYATSDRGRAILTDQNQRRIYLGGYRGRAETVTQAERIRAHIKERVIEFKQGFADGKKTQGSSSGKVPPEAAV